MPPERDAPVAHVLECLDAVRVDSRAPALGGADRLDSGCPGPGRERHELLGETKRQSSALGPLADRRSRGGGVGS